MAFSSDDTIFARAEAENRIIVTADLDFSRLVATAKSDGPRLILFRAGDWSDGDAIARLGRVLDLIPEAELPSSVIVVERTKIRRRSLPIE